MGEFNYAAAISLLFKDVAAGAASKVRPRRGKSNFVLWERAETRQNDLVGHLSLKSSTETIEVTTLVFPERMYWCSNTEIWKAGYALQAIIQKLKPPTEIRGIAYFWKLKDEDGVPYFDRKRKIETYRTGDPASEKFLNKLTQAN